MMLVAIVVLRGHIVVAASVRHFDVGIEARALLADAIQMLEDGKETLLFDEERRSEARKGMFSSGAKRSWQWARFD